MAPDAQPHYAENSCKKALEHFKLIAPHGQILQVENHCFEVSQTFLKMQIYLFRN